MTRFVRHFTENTQLKKGAPSAKKVTVHDLGSRLGPRNSHESQTTYSVTLTSGRRRDPQGVGKGLPGNLEGRPEGVREKTNKKRLGLTTSGSLGLPGWGDRGRVVETTLYGSPSLTRTHLHPPYARRRCGGHPSMRIVIDNFCVFTKTRILTEGVPGMGPPCPAECVVTDPVVFPTFGGLRLIPPVTFCATTEVSYPITVHTSLL